MEHVAATLRGQGGEETERLRQEHHRLQVMQVNIACLLIPLSFPLLQLAWPRLIDVLSLPLPKTSLESERLALQSRAAEDNSAMRQKARDMEAEGRKAQEERRCVQYLIPLWAPCVPYKCLIGGAIYIVTHLCT